MRFVHNETHEEVSEATVRGRFSTRALSTLEDFADVGYSPLTETPSGATSSQNASRSVAQVNGIWTTVWTLTDKTAEELAAMIPKTVTSVQAKTALYDAGLYASIATYMLTAPVPQQLAWNDSPTFDRQSPTLQAIAGALGLSSTQLDALFIAASQVIV